MKVSAKHPTQVTRSKMAALRWLAALLLAAATPAFCMDDAMTQCMSQLLQQADDSTTVGELREKCAVQAQASEVQAGEQEQTAVDVRLKKDRENVLQPFTLMAHKPSYYLFAAHNQRGYSTEYYEQHFGRSDVAFNDTEAQFQFSLKVPLGVDLFKSFDIYAAYTNRSFWQLYNQDISRPFRETNHEPEAWLQFTPGWEMFGFKNSANAIGVVHQSNGRGGELSRSWNRIYANFVFQRGNFALGFKPWIRLSEAAEDDDNPDITDYLGHFELRAGYKWKQQVFSIMSRNNLESGFDRGAVELGWSFPLWSYPYLKGYIQYFHGFGESLIDYNQRVNRIGIGITLTDWL